MSWDKSASVFFITSGTECNKVLNNKNFNLYKLFAI